MNRIKRAALVAVALGASVGLVGGVAPVEASTSDCGQRWCLWDGQNYPGNPNWDYGSTGNSGVSYKSRYNGFSNRKLNRYTDFNQTGTGTCVNALHGNTFSSYSYVGSHLIYGPGTIC